MLLLQAHGIDTPTGTVIADGTADYKITAAGSTSNIENRFTLYPSADNMPQVNYPVNMPNQGFDPLTNIVLIAYRTNSGRTDNAWQPKRKQD